MERNRMFDCMIPRPLEVCCAAGSLPLAKLTGIGAAKELIPIGQRLGAALERYELYLPCGAARSDGAIVLRFDPDLRTEAWKINIHSAGITLCGGDAAGVFYGTEALTQLICVCRRHGWADDEIPFGTIVDMPRYRWRGIMLDSARHFQPAEQILRLLAILGKHRINIFHWHLSDNEGFRTPSRLAPALNRIGRISAGCYSHAELEEIRQVAGQNFITIVPEIEMPGHCGGILQCFPEYACNPSSPGAELCLGKPAVREFMKSLIAEFSALFPESPFLHLAGDEANHAAWQSCGDCQRMLQDKQLENVRELESDFMREMIRYVSLTGREPITWATENELSGEGVVQCWGSDQEVGRQRKRRGQYIYSLNKHCYFDFPASPGEELFPWTSPLPEIAVYDAHACAVWENVLAEKLLGIEACLWTEAVPGWRTLPKVVPRLQAWAENSWSMPERKEYHDFCRRKELLTACGYLFDQ